MHYVLNRIETIAYNRASIVVDIQMIVELAAAAAAAVDMDQLDMVLKKRRGHS